MGMRLYSDRALARLMTSTVPPADRRWISAQRVTRFSGKKADMTIPSLSCATDGYIEGVVPEAVIL